MYCVKKEFNVFNKLKISTSKVYRFKLVIFSNISLIPIIVQ